MDVAVLHCTLWCLMRLICQLWIVAANTVVRDMSGPILYLNVFSSAGYLMSLPFVSPRFGRRYLISIFVNRSFPLFCLLILLDTLNFGDVSTPGQYSRTFLLHSELLATVFFLNARSDRCWPLIISPITYMLLLAQVIRTYGALRSTTGGDSIPAIANHAILNMNQVMFIISVLMYVAQKLFDPTENVLFVPKGMMDEVVPANDRPLVPLWNVCHTERPPVTPHVQRFADDPPINNAGPGSCGTLNCCTNRSRGASALINDDESDEISRRRLAAAVARDPLAAQVMTARNEPLLQM